MTDHPSALVTVPPHALEAIAFNLCSLHDFDPAFVQQNERFAKAAITEYLRATTAPAAPQAAGVGECEACNDTGIRPTADGAGHYCENGCAPSTREEAPAEAGEIDLYDDKVQAGIAWTMRQWGETLGLKTWTGGDGSESVEGDVGAEIHTILVDAGLRDPETNEMASLRAQPQAREDAQPDAGAKLAKAMWGVDLAPAASPAPDALRVRVQELEQWQASAIRSARLHDQNIREFDARATAAEAKISQATDALEEIRDTGSDGEHSGDRHARCRDIARQALAALQQEGR